MAFPTAYEFPARPQSRPRLARVAVGLLGAVSLAWALEAQAADGPAAAPAKLSAAQILAKHVAARGGLAAWQGVQSMAWQGKMEAGTGDSPARSARFAHTAPNQKKAMEQAATQPGEKPAAEAKQVQLPYVLDMKRPAMSRLELEFNGKTAVQVYDGKAGWKLRPFLNRETWEPFTADELKASQGKWELDGPLLDAAAKGTKVEVEGSDPIDGSPAYRLKLTLKDGSVQHIWIDARSFLDVRIEGSPRRMDGRLRKVYITQRDFRSEQGLLLPHVLETSVEGYADVHKMTVDRVSLNPVLGDAMFTKGKPGA
jgi:hypothetical protein